MTDKYQNIAEIAEEVAKIKVDRFTTTIPEIDEMIDGGLRSGSFNVVVADSGLGKSNYILKLALELAKQGVKVHLVSVEMGKKDVVDRLLAMAGDIPFNELRNQNQEKMDELVEALGLLRETLFLTFSSDVNDILTDIEIHKDEQNTQVVLIDHIHAITSESTSEYIEEMALLKALKTLWIDQNLCIIAAAQQKKMAPGEIKQAMGEKENIRGSAKWFHFASQLFYFLESKQQKEHNYREEKIPGEPNLLTLILSKSRYRSRNFKPAHVLESKPWMGEFKYLKPINIKKDD
jgi:archaellum biogenesis ATPase FlaH